MADSAALAYPWLAVCAPDDVVPDRGVCALVDGQQVAIFRTSEAWFGLGNFDPWSGANVLSRGIVGDIGGITCVASPIYKQHFCLRSGRCLEDENVSVPVYSVRVLQGAVEVSLAPDAE